MSPRRLLLVITSLLLPATLQAGVYRWVDENGVTVYSQVPPPADIQREQMPAPPPPPVTEKEAWKEVNQDWRKMRDRRDIIKEQATADSESAARTQDKKKNCEIAQRTIEELEFSRRKLIKTADGKLQRISAEEREERLVKAREMQSKYCEQ
ncbi:MAG: DUF4124 domain-containing protein [Chromatiaceae bacterium]|nr:DUF4124 domain-containing protein [Gammaproteobacteria bacterium]MCP5448629.1 DUF4124 domain-containing protein [Chromatiaceae bacterium]MCB1861944.1 DUF4124 domain-containing protein [Gammaproteobacteria bacterium]MCB1873695.1 DUF4124 domain-containing protein [Gammaproteobacteria bacterium]MCB1878585.1 DUF4124 domain-containing protein [Gammaproteobacteria bacterium]